MSKAQTSHNPFNTPIRGSGKESAPPSKEALALVALLEEYVKEDAEGELCTVIHEKGECCRKVEGHE